VIAAAGRDRRRRSERVDGRSTRHSLQALALALFGVPRSRSSEEPIKLVHDVPDTGPRNVDVVGAVLSVLGMGGLMLGILVWQEGGEAVRKVRHTS
jgi:hypothetical protein